AGPSDIDGRGRSGGRIFEGCPGFCQAGGCYLAGGRTEKYLGRFVVGGEPRMTKEAGPGMDVAGTLPSGLTGSEPKASGVDSLGSGRTTSAPPPSSAPLSRGATLGRYVVLDVVGGGAMGVVYAAYDPELDRQVAIKLVRPE